MHGNTIHGAVNPDNYVENVKANRGVLKISVNGVMDRLQLITSHIYDYNC
jgi:hypothetical protein